MSRYIRLAGFLILAFSLLGVLSSWKHTDLASAVVWSIICFAMLKLLGSGIEARIYGLVVGREHVEAHVEARPVHVFTLALFNPPAVPPVSVPRTIPEAWILCVKKGRGRVRKIRVTKEIYECFEDYDQYDMFYGIQP